MDQKKNKIKTIRQEYTALDRVKAILAVWSERRKPSHVCKELSINWQQLRNWEDRAMEAMVKALEPRRQRPIPPALGRRVEKLLNRKAIPTTTTIETRLTKRLTSLQKGKDEKSPAKSC